MTISQNKAMRHAPRQVKLHCDYDTMTATVVISRMNRRGSYSARRYTLQDVDPSAKRLGKVMSRYPCRLTQDWIEIAPNAPSTPRLNWSVYDVRR